MNLTHAGLLSLPANPGCMVVFDCWYVGYMLMLWTDYWRPTRTDSAPLRMRRTCPGRSPCPQTRSPCPFVCTAPGVQLAMRGYAVSPVLRLWGTSRVSTMPSHSCESRGTHAACHRNDACYSLNGWFPASDGQGRGCCCWLERGGRGGGASVPLGELRCVAEAGVT